MRSFLFALTVIIFVHANVYARAFVYVLGNAQDAGAPQAGCISKFCKGAWENRELRKMVASLAIINGNDRWIIDATPDFPEQFEMVKKITDDYSNHLNGIFLTHAHIGHYTGLMYLGRESMGAKGVQVYAMPRMEEMLIENAPWSQLVSLGNIELKRLADGKNVSLSRELSIRPFLVPHRDEFSETVGYRIASRSKSLIYIPDIDKWSKWDQDLRKVVLENDFVLIDGTFFEDGEIPRPMSEVPHPFVSESMKLLDGLSRIEKSKVYFTHFNHSNPLIQGDKRTIRMLQNKGFRIAEAGLRLNIE